MKPELCSSKNVVVCGNEQVIRLEDHFFVLTSSDECLRLLSFSLSSRFLQDKGSCQTCQARSSYQCLFLLHLSFFLILHLFQSKEFLSFKLIQFTLYKQYEKLEVSLCCCDLDILDRVFQSGLHHVLQRIDSSVCHLQRLVQCHEGSLEIGQFNQQLNCGCE